MSGFVTARMRAVPIAQGDVDFLYRLWSDETVGATLGGVRSRAAAERVIAESAEHWSLHGFGRWILWAGDQRVGTAKLEYCQWTGIPEVELGYAIVPDLWNQGYASEAARGALDYARDETSLVQVIALVGAGNPRSVAVLQRLSFTRDRELQLEEGPHSLYRCPVRQAPSTALGPVAANSKADAQIRRAGVDDAAAIATVHVASWRSAYRDLLPASMLRSLSVERRAIQWRERLAHDNQTTLVALDHGRVIGFASGGQSREPDAGRREGELYAIYLDPSAWGRGLGRALHEAATVYLASEYDEAVLWVLLANDRARGFYERHGWSADGAVKVEHRDGVALDEVRYRRSLRRGERGGPP